MYVINYILSKCRFNIQKHALGQRWPNSSVKTIWVVSTCQTFRVLTIES